MINPRRLQIFCALLATQLLLIPCYAHTPAEEMAEDANNFLNSLTPEQRTKATYEFKNGERFNWAFVPQARNGLPFKEMTPPQQKLGYELLRSAMSQGGYTKATNLMFNLEQVLKDLENGAARRDTQLYYVTIFGKPGESAWGWRVEGHHLAINITIDGGEVIADTPSFFGANPGEVKSGPRQGLRNLGAEEDLAYKLMNALTDEQRGTVIITTNAPREIITSNARKAHSLDPVGINSTKLTKPQQEMLLTLIKEYVYRYRPEIADKDLKKIQDAGFDKITFAWAGTLNKSEGHYYRIQGPTFLMEFDNTQGNANHIHTVWRDFENDFGEDILRKHYDQTPHAK
jgi:hypothetical protein